MMVATTVSLTPDLAGGNIRLERLLKHIVW